MIEMKNSIMLFASLVMQVILFKIGDCSFVKNSWKPVSVSNALLQDPSVKSQEIYSVSDLICSIVATKSRWANLFCHEDNRCRLFDLLVVSGWNESVISDPVNCMTKTSDLCDTNISPCRNLDPASVTCTAKSATNAECSCNAGLIPINNDAGTLIECRMGCAAGFTEVGSNLCIKLDCEAESIYTEAVTYCRGLGSNVPVWNNEAEYNQIIDFHANQATRCNAWLGISDAAVEDTWVFDVLTTGPAISSKTSDELGYIWNSMEPNESPTSNEDYAYIYDGYGYEAADSKRNDARVFPMCVTFVD